MMTTNETTSADIPEYASWPDVDESLLSEKDRKIFLLRKEAVIRKIDGDSNQVIQRITGYSRQEVRRFKERCRSPGPDNRIWGFRILVPGTWEGKGHRKQKPTPQGENRGGLAYAFSWLLETYPDIEELITNLAIAKAEKGKVAEKAMMTKNIHQEMLAALRAKGLTDADYPFFTKDKALRSLTLFVDGLYTTHFKSMVKNQAGDSKARNMGSGKMGQEPPATRPNQQMELDAHRLDGEYVLSFEMGRYPPKTKIIQRPWLLALLDRFTRVIWAYLIVLAKEPNHLDILRLFKRFIGPWSLPELPPDSPFRYKEGAGMPKDIVSDCEYPLGDEIYVDNAWVYLAKQVKRVVTRVNGGSFILGRYRTPTDRPYIESYYSKIALIFQRFPNTTGSYPGDFRRQNPEDAAIKYHMDYNFLNQLLATVMANYNATKNIELGNNTPLQMLAHSTATEPLRMLLNPNDLNDLNLRVTRVVRGGKKEGRRPYIQYENVRYSSENLAKTPSMIGQKLELNVDYDKMHIINAYLENGCFFDYLIPKDRKWQVPHTYEDRKLFYQYEGVVEEEDQIHSAIINLGQTQSKKQIQEDMQQRAKVQTFKKLSERPEDDGKTIVEE